MRWLGLLSLLLVAACGGGGGGGGGGPLPAIEQDFAFGTVRADAPTTRVVTVTNPLAADAMAEDMGGAVGPFAAQPGALPVDVAGGADLSVQVVFTPSSPGAQEGEIHLRFVAGTQERDVVLKLTASVETPTLTLLTPKLTFGSLIVGEQKTLDVRVRNDNQGTPVSLTAIGTLPADFTTSFASHTLLPGDLFVFQVTYAPQATGDQDFFFALVNDVGATVNVHVVAHAETWPDEQVTDFGTVALSNGQTDWLEVDLSQDAISLSIEAVSTSSATNAGLLAFEGPGGKVYENEQATGLFLWSQGTDGVFALTLPESDNPDVQLVPGGGTYRFRLYRYSGTGTSFNVRTIVENRPGAVVDESKIDMNIFLAPGLNITGPETDTKLQAVITRIDDIFSQVGLHVGDVAYYQIGSSAYNSVSQSEFPQLLEKSSAASETRANVFFVQSAIGGGVIGIAGGIPGPKLNGSPVSGVMVDYDFDNAAAVGQVTAHELGHYLGLYHTVEQGGGQWDIISDTLECPGSGTNSVCTTEGGGYLMHWQYESNAMPTITAGQAHVILAHPLVDPLPGLAGLSSLAQKKAPVLEWVQLPPGFCGTCNAHK